MSSSQTSDEGELFDELILKTLPMCCGLPEMSFKLLHSVDKLQNSQQIVCVCGAAVLKSTAIYCITEVNVV